MTDVDKLTPVSYAQLKAMVENPKLTRHNRSTVAGFLSLYGRFAPMLPAHHLLASTEEHNVVVVSKTDLPTTKGWFDLKAEDGTLVALYFLPGMDTERALVAGWYVGADETLGVMNSRAETMDGLYDILDKLGH